MCGGRAVRPQSPSRLLPPTRRGGGRTTKSAATLTVASVPRPGRFRDLIWPAGHHPLNIRSTSAQVAVMALPPSAAPRRRAPPQGRLSGRSSPRSELRRFAAPVAVLAGAPVSVARPRPRPKGTTAPGKPARCDSRASPDPGHRPSTRRTVRPWRDPGACGTRRQPSPARPAVVAYGISPRSRERLPEPCHCIEYTADRVDSFVGHVPLSRGIPPPAGVSRYFPPRVRGGGRDEVRAQEPGNGWPSRVRGPSVVSALRRSRSAGSPPPGRGRSVSGMRS